MQIINTKKIIAAALVVFGLFGSALASSGMFNSAGVSLPTCTGVEVPVGHVLAFRAYALGVQIYRWNGSAWAFIAPEANLYADANFRGKVGTHYGGPTWESNSGSNVVARRANGCSADPNAIDWLLLEKVSTEGPGIFEPVTYIRRVETAGGKAPASAGQAVGDEARVPYTAVYYFYRAE